ncbi:transposase [Dactylosporangium aurantiacum]|uniref:transposase n=1 Tax=Dactylosporangium aurantiacum TaxID=35754 RepID=UPI001FE0BFD4|nr:transposase [Dactylosporangium aurantiacum]MDG6110408.1 transposase [Dactylosporangium aurantiacum]
MSTHFTCAAHERRRFAYVRGTAAWHAKEDLLDLLATARTRPNREQVRDLLYRFFRRCADADLPVLQRLATTVETWWPEILAFLHTGITYAGSEGTNRVIKPSPATPTASATPSNSDYEPEPPPPQSPWASRPPLNSKAPNRACANLTGHHRPGAAWRTCGTIRMGSSGWLGRRGAVDHRQPTPRTCRSPW